MFGKSRPNYQPIKNLAELASEKYQELVNCYFRKNPESPDGAKDYQVIKCKGFTQYGTNASTPPANRSLGLTSFTPSVGTYGALYAAWDRAGDDYTEIWKLSSGDPAAVGVYSYFPTQDTDMEFEQVNDNQYATNGIDGTVRQTGSTGAWANLATGEPLSGSGTTSKYLAWFNFMLFAARTVNAPNKLNVSDAGTPETFSGNTKTFRHSIIGMKPLGDYLMVYTTKEIWAVTGTAPSLLSFRELLNAHPCVSNRSITKVTGDNGSLEHYYLGSDYVWATDGYNFRILGKESWENYRSSLSNAQLALAAGIFDEESGQYWLSVPTGAETINKVTWAYDPVADKWIEKPLWAVACWAKHGAPKPSIYFLDANSSGKAYVANSGNAIPILKTTLTGNHAIDVTTLTVGSTAGFPTTGVVQIENEAISYSALAATEFQGCIRGYQGTTAATHAGSTAVYPAHQFRYRTRNLDFGENNLIKKYQILWVNVETSTSTYSLSVNVDVDQQGYSNAKNIPLATDGMIWGTDVWGAATWGANNILLTPINRAPLIGRGKTIKISLDEYSSLDQTTVTEMELRMRPLKKK